MYKLIVHNKIGDYLKTKAGVVYKVTAVSVNIIFNEKSMREEARLLYEGVDARDPFGQFYIISGHMVTPATKEEVDYYVLGPQANKELSKIAAGVMGVNQKEIPNKVINEKKEEEKVRTIDDVLDDSLITEDFIKIFGDKDGEYRKKLDKLADEFKTLSK